jgi:hypothetical protein
MSELLYDHVLKRMDETLQHFCALVPPPTTVPFADSFVYRYKEATIHQAIVQKCARCLSTLHAALLLMQHGFVQEQAVLQRVLDEINEDITFLAFGVIRNEVTDSHLKFLGALYEEEYDSLTGKPTERKKPMLPRRKIHAYLASAYGEDPHSAATNMRIVSKTYSGYVHAASPQTMDMFLGDPPRFQTRGVRGSYRHEEHREDLWNSFYRGILAFGFAAKALGDESMFESIRAFSVNFASKAGYDYGPGARGA